MLKLKKVHENAIVPKRSNPTDSGLDLCSTEYVCIPPGECRVVGTGWQMAVDVGEEIQIRSRSGLAAKNKISVLNAPGTVDQSYRGEVKVILMNHSKVLFEIKTGDRIAQAVVAKVSLDTPEVVEELDETERGSGGFGSTGV